MSVWEDRIASQAVMACATVVESALQVSAVLTAESRDHWILFRISELRRAMREATGALDMLEKQVRARKHVPTAEERQLVRKVKAGLRAHGGTA